jgi:benzoyl-CoA reductase/2-hydroxyglutaryl-CoA dehydratase subunit BcrC/BadD/HgdB
MLPLGHTQDRVSELLESLRRRHDHRDEFARQWSARGGQVLAYMCDNFPHELVTAVGMLPFRLRGDPSAPASQVARYVSADRNPVVAVPAFVDAMLEPLLSGAHDFVDYIVVPHGRKAIELSYESLTRARAAGAPMRDVELFYLDKSWVPGAASSVFDRERLLELAAQLEEWAGNPIDDAALTEAVAEAERGRALLARLNRLRLKRPPRLSGSDALLVYSLASAMPRAEHNRLVEELVAHGADLPPREGPRIYLAGSPQPSTALYELVERSGATVVGEDHCWGERVTGCPIPPGPSGIERLAERYHRTPVCSIEFPLEGALARWRAAVRMARPDGVLFFVVSGDELHVWDTPEKAALLAADGIPNLHLGRQGYEVDGRELTEALAAWLSGLS